MSASTLALTVLAGLSEASVLFLVASGLSLVFGALRVINMAHGSLYMVAAFITTAIVSIFSQPTIGFLLALILAPAVVAVIGALIEILVLRRLYRREHLLQLLATYALTLVFAGGVRIVFGSQNRSIRPPEFLSGGVALGSLTFPTYKFFLMFAALVVAAGLYFLLYRTTLGRNIRAAVADPELLNASGVNVARLFTTVFMIGAGLAALGGVLVSPDQAVTGGMDTDVLVAAFAISVIGGLGSLMGSFVGALIVGLATSFGILFPQTSRWSLAFIFVLMAVVLMIRPWGLFGRPEST
jgi:branched-subunit amino acid ABC-type transport system permease component